MRRGGFEAFWVWLMAGLLFSAAAQAQKPRIICWTDNKGQRVCGDRVPPEYAKTESQVLDDHGRVVQTNKRELTTEERAAIQAKADAELAQRKLASDAAAYDTFLTQSYGTTGDLMRARNDRLTAIDGRMAISAKTLADNNRTRDKLRQEAATAPNDGDLQTQLQAFERNVAQSQQTLDGLAAERTDVCAKFAADLKRYRELKGLPPSAISGCPTKEELAAKP